jgi:hypothetical protein
MRELVAWTGKGNLYHAPLDYLDAWGWSSVDYLDAWGWSPVDYLDAWGWSPVKYRPAWDSFWGRAEPGSRDGQPLYRNAAAIDLEASRPEQLKPVLFELTAVARSNPPGIRANRIGPGQPFVDWKQMTEYARWLHDTGQTRPAGRTVAMIVPHRGFWSPDYQSVRCRLVREGAAVVIASSRPGTATPQEDKEGSGPEVSVDQTVENLATDDVGGGRRLWWSRVQRVHRRSSRRCGHQAVAQGSPGQGPAHVRQLRRRERPRRRRRAARARGDDHPSKSRERRDERWHVRG